MTKKTILNQALNQVDRLLKQFAKDPLFNEQIQTAFGVGADASMFQSAWRQGNFSDFPEIVIKHSAEINGANGAFSIDTGKIYLSEELVNGGKIRAIASVLLEEYGHYVDSNINTVDAAGDEGAIFAALVQKDHLTNQQLSAMRNENDQATIYIDGVAITIEQSISQIGSFTGNAINVQVVGDLAFVGGLEEYVPGLEGFVILDVSDPTAPKKLGSFDTRGYAWDVQVVGDRAFVANDYSGLLILDVSNPAAPSQLGSFDTSGNAYNVQVVGDQAFVADGDAGLVILNVSNPAAPKKLGSFDTTGFAASVQVVGDRAFVADGGGGLVILDVSNPAAPYQLGSFDTSGYAYNVQVVGDRAFVAGSDGLFILDVSNSDAPQKLGSFDTYASDVEVVGDQAFVTDWDGGLGLVILDVSNPAAPSLLESFDTTGSAVKVEVVGDQAFVTNNYGGLYILDVSDFTSEIITINSATTTTLAANATHLNLTGTGNIKGTGNALNNRITGNTGNNTLTGGAGNDTLNGGAGSDTLNGGAGNDVYILDTISASNKTIKSTPNLAIPDVQTVTSTVNLSNLTGTIADLNVTLNIDHTWVADLVVRLTSPDGTRVTLINSVGSDGDNFTNTILDDEADQSLLDNAAPFTGSFQPQESLSNFDDKIPNGTWTLTIEDQAGGDVGVLKDWSINLTLTPGPDKINESAGQGSDTVQSKFTYTLGLNLENLTLIGTDPINGTGNTLNNIITGNVANNILTGGKGNDTLNGDEGDDIAVFSGKYSDYTITVSDNGTLTVKDKVLSRDGTDTLSNIETIKFNGDNSYYNVLNESLYVLSSAATWTNAQSQAKGLGGNLVTINNETEQQWLQNTFGDEHFWIGLTDQVTERRFKWISGETSSYENWSSGEPNNWGGDEYYVEMANGQWNDENNTRHGKGLPRGIIEIPNFKFDSTVYASSTRILATSEKNLTLTGTANINGTGNALDNIITGNTAINSLTGGAGNDTLNGGLGRDTLKGGLGDDVYIINDLYTNNATRPIITELLNQGQDIVASSVTYTLTANVEDLSLTGTETINGTGNGLNNTITGNIANNSLNGGLGDDFLKGGKGDDILDGGLGRDTAVLSGNLADYTITYPDASTVMITDKVGDRDGIDTLKGVEFIKFKDIDSYDLAKKQEEINSPQIKALVVEGRKWDTTNTLTNNTGKDTLTITYSFSSDISLGIKETFETIFRQISQYINLDFQTATTGDINISLGTSGNEWSDERAFGNYPGSGLGGDIYLKPQYFQNQNVNEYRIGSQEFSIFIHEIGHALGLKHPDSLAIAERNTDNTAMVVSDKMGSPVASFMPFDINALESLYGERQINGANTTYSFSNIFNYKIGTDRFGGSTPVKLTIKDTDGIDTVDFSSNIMPSGNYILNIASTGGILTRSERLSYPETNSTNYTWKSGTRIADGTQIEKVIGSDFNDEITGNELPNTLQGGEGNDTLKGYLGDDTLEGGLGKDILIGGLGKDSLIGGAGDDFYYVDSTTDDITESPDEGKDRIYANVTYTLGANVENLYLTGGYGDDVRNIKGTGNARNNKIMGNADNNTLVGGAGNDTLIGSYYQSTFDHTLTGGVDILTGGTGNDTFELTLADPGIDVITDYKYATPTQLDPDAKIKIFVNLASDDEKIDTQYNKFSLVKSNSDLQIKYEGGAIATLKNPAGISSSTTVRDLIELVSLNSGAPDDEGEWYFLPQYDG